MSETIKQPGMTNAEYLRALRQRAVEKGKCYQCRMRWQKPGARYCAECIARSRAGEASFVRRRMCIDCCCNLPRGATQQRCPGCREATYEQRRAQVVAWVAAGLCSQCGKRAPMHRRRRCLACNEDGRLRMIAFYRKRGGTPKKGACSVCTAMGMPGTGHTKATHARYMALAAHWQDA